jgi:hypothetical protein
MKEKVAADEDIRSYMPIFEFWNAIYFTNVMSESNPRMFENKSSIAARR